MNKSQKHDDSIDGFRGDWHKRGDGVDVLDGYVSRAELAKQLGHTERTLARWFKSRTGPPVTIIGRVHYYRLDAARAWLLQREQKMVREGGGRGRVA